jgi:type VI secretion system protein ImpA
MSRLPDLETLIKPISESRPEGEDVYSTTHRKIKQARSAEPDSTGKPRDPDWNSVLKLGIDALQKESKDLFIAAYVTEAVARLDGLEGLRQGFDLFRLLQDAFWESAYPTVENHDYRSRLSAYEWVDESVPTFLYVGIPLTAAPLAENSNLQQFSLQNLTDAERDARDDAIRRTDPRFHQRLAAELAACRSAFEAWNESTLQHFKKSKTTAPSLERVTVALGKLDACLRTIGQVRPFVVAGAPGAPSAPVSATAEASSPAMSGTGGEFSARPDAGDHGQPQSWDADSQREPSRENGVTDDPRDLAELARKMADTGGIDAAIELLDRARQSARCRRDRFRRQLELAELCVRGRLFRVARPLIEELAAEQTDRRLEEWEDPALCARVLAAWLLCLRVPETEQDSAQIPEIYQRLCRLDPGRALRQQPPDA